MSDSDSEDNIIRYGTPLEPYEEDEVPSKRKYQEPTDQFAVDAHGRRRFHGAFTGGFSAGFGNTVGSQEGWTPQTFKSSRLEKAAQSIQKPEDFMDEDDRSEFGIAPRQMQTSSEFSGQKRQRPRAFHDGPIPGEPVLEQLLRPVHETCAVRMLRGMGWRAGGGAGGREGRGAGARPRGEGTRQAKEQHRVYGCYVPPEMRLKEPSDEESSDSEVDYDTLFAPDDYEPYVLRQKSDRFGLGYQGLSRHSVLGNLVGEYGSGDGRSKLVMKDKGKKVSIRGQAFGVGAFEADDEDIYATEDMSHYDFTLGAPARGPGPTVPKREGPNVLPGFSRARKPLPSVPAYPPPALPRDYAPLPAGARRSRFEPSQAPQRDQGLGRHELTAEARGQLLGETPPVKHTDTQTNTQTIQSKRDELLSKIMGKSRDFISTESKTTVVIDMTKSENIIDMTSRKETPDFISIKDSGKELVNVFQPFKSNPKKQARYEEYCATGAVERDRDMDKLSEWEREREMVEFEQAAKLYRPLTGIMGDRFTHAAIPDDVNPLTAVARTSAGHSAATPEQCEAASNACYGVMTRSRAEWRPDSIVCKRFNVPEPNVTRLEPKKDERPKVSYSVFSYMETSVHDKNSFTREQGKFSGSKSQRDHADTRHDQKTPTDQNPQSSDQHRQNSDRNLQNSDQNSDISDQNTTFKSNQTNVPKISEQNNPYKRMTVAELFIKESETTKEQGKEVTEAIEKFDRMDLYKAIFLSDSEDEDEFKANDTIKIIEDTNFVEAPKNIARNTSPPRGIFANINFDEINSWKRTEKPKEDTPNDLEKDTEQAYGPKIPDSLKNRLESGQNDTNKIDDKIADSVEVIGSSSDDSWVDAKEVKAKKSKKKKKHKTKDKKKKSKHKKKDR